MKNVIGSVLEGIKTYVSFAFPFIMRGDAQEILCVDITNLILDRSLWRELSAQTRFDFVLTMRETLPDESAVLAFRQIIESPFQAEQRMTLLMLMNMPMRYSYPYLLTLLELIDEPWLTVRILMAFTNRRKRTAAPIVMLFTKSRDFCVRVAAVVFLNKFCPEQCTLKLNAKVLLQDFNNMALTERVQVLETLAGWYSNETALQGELEKMCKQNPKNSKGSRIIEAQH